MPGSNRPQRFILKRLRQVRPLDAGIDYFAFSGDCENNVNEPIPAVGSLLRTSFAPEQGTESKQNSELPHTVSRPELAPAPPTSRALGLGPQGAPQPRLHATEDSCACPSSRFCFGPHHFNPGDLSQGADNKLNSQIVPGAGGENQRALGHEGEVRMREFVGGSVRDVNAQRLLSRSCDELLHGRLCHGWRLAPRLLGCQTVA